MYAPNVERWVAVKGKTLYVGYRCHLLKTYKAGVSDLGEVFGKMVQK